MFRFALRPSALTALVLLGAPFLANAQPVDLPAIIANPGTTQTSGIVGVTSTQTARLNVLNLQPAIPGVAAVACPVTLEFYDDTGAVLKQLALTTVAPAAAASLVFKPVVPTTSPTARAQIRAALVTPPPMIANPGVGSIYPLSLGCTFMASLEIIDDSSGATHVFTTDLRNVPVFTAIPLPVMR